MLKTAVIMQTEYKKTKTHKIQTYTHMFPEDSISNFLTQETASKRPTLAKEDHI
jgi:hypothetical protein